MVDSSVQTDKNLSAAQDRLSSFQAMALVLGRYGALIALACLVFYFSLASPYFLTVGNLLQILNRFARRHRRGRPHRRPRGRSLRPEHRLYGESCGYNHD